MKTCFCDACQTCDPRPENCRLLKPNIFTLIDYANRTMKELNESLRGTYDFDKR